MFMVMGMVSGVEKKESKNAYGEGFLLFACGCGFVDSSMVLHPHLHLEAAQPE